MRKLFTALSYLLVVGILVCPTASRAQTTLFMDDFSGSGAVLNGATPDITTNSEVWETGDTFFDDGTADSPIAAGPDGQAAHLDFTPQGGAIYTAETTFTNTNTNWLAFGFLPDEPPVADWTVQDFSVRHSNAPGYAWALSRNNPGANNQEGFLGGGVGGAQPWNGNVVDATQPIDFRIILDTTGVNWTSQWFINDVSQGDPVAYGVEGNPGIGGIGFSHERNATANSGATIASFSLTEEIAPTALTLFVDNSAVGGDTILRNTSSDPVSLNYYIIESSADELDTNGWDSLQDQGITADLSADFDNSGMVDAGDLDDWEGDFGLNGDSDADGDSDSDGRDFMFWQRQFGQSAEFISSWQEAGGVSSSTLAELLLDGVTTLQPNEELNLGDAFDPTVSGIDVPGNLTFRFGAPGQGLRLGAVIYGPSPVSAAVVPEPSALSLLLSAFAVGWLVVRRLRRYSVKVFLAAAASSPWFGAELRKL